jgi:hypothetical protein
VVSTQILIACPANASTNPAATTAGGANGSPSTGWATALPASSTVIHLGLPVRRTTAGVTTAASSVPAAPAASTSPSPASPPGKSPPAPAKVFRYSSRAIRVRTP